MGYSAPATKIRWDTVSPLKGSLARRLFSWTFEGQLGVSGVPVVEDYVFPLKDLENDVIHEITAKEYDFLPSTM